MRDGKMHQTTVRFNPDVWRALEDECRRLGVSAAQYLREAVIARLSYTAGLRGEHEYEEELMRAGAPASRSAAESARARGQVAAAAGRELRYDTTAVAAQSQLARERSQLLRERAEKLRDRRAARSVK